MNTVTVHTVQTFKACVRRMAGFANEPSDLLGEELTRVRTELWRATVAAVAYYGMRCFAVHGFGTTPLSLSNTTYKGKAAPELSFDRLYNVLVNLHSELENRSLKSTNCVGMTKWFNGGET